MKYKIGELEVEAIQWNGRNEKELIDICKRIKNTNDFNYGDYLLTSETSSFIVSEQDFNKIATKVKEYKFKVGDDVYYIERETKICKAKNEGRTNTEEPYIYHTKDNSGRIEYSREEELLTLEEAIEKLKEL